jgi:hypothetical protein
MFATTPIRLHIPQTTFGFYFEVHVRSILTDASMVIKVIGTPSTGDNTVRICNNSNNNDNVDGALLSFGSGDTVGVGVTPTGYVFFTLNGTFCETSAKKNSSRQRILHGSTCSVQLMLTQGAAICYHLGQKGRPSFFIFRQGNEEGENAITTSSRDIHRPTWALFDIVSVVASYLPPASLCAVTRVNRAFHVATSLDEIWLPLYVKEFEGTTTTKRLPPSKDYRVWYYHEQLSARRAVEREKYRTTISDVTLASLSALVPKHVTLKEILEARKPF